MGTFKYKAKDRRGRVQSGLIEGGSKSLVKTQLTRMGYRPIKVVATEVGKSSSSSSDDGFLGGMIYRDEKGALQIQLGNPNPSTKDLIIFTKQFATMLNSGVPMIQALAILASQQRVRLFGKTLERVRADVENGATLSDALLRYPKTFDPLYVAMVKAGEASGHLDTILSRLVIYIEKAAKIKSQVKSAMLYPSIVIVVALAVIAALLLFVVPTFAQQYTETGKELPELTQFVIDLSNGLQENFLYLISGLAGMLVLFLTWKKTPAGHMVWDRFMLRCPGLGELLRKVAVGRFCSTMATMLNSGVNLLEALNICASSSGNIVIEKFILNLREKIEQGVKFSEPLGEGDLFPPMVVSMVAVGEATGALDEMLHKVSEFYEEEVDLAVKTLLSMVEPIMIVGIGGIVGFIVIAMYLPVFDIAGTVGK